MIKKIAWDTFKNTGDIDAFLEFKQIQNIENEIIQKDTLEELNKLNSEFEKVE